MKLENILVLLPLLAFSCAEKSSSSNELTGGAAVMETMIVEGRVILERPCVRDHLAEPSYCLNIDKFDIPNEFSGLFYISPDIRSETIFDRSDMDEKGYPNEGYRLTDDVTGQSLDVKVGHSVRFEAEVKRDREATVYAGTIHRILGPR